MSINWSVSVNPRHLINLKTIFFPFWYKDFSKRNLLYSLVKKSNKRLKKKLYFKGSKTIIKPKKAKKVLR